MVLFVGAAVGFMDVENFVGATEKKLRKSVQKATKNSYAEMIKLSSVRL
jgi:hypothetical protein